MAAAVIRRGEPYSSTQPTGASVKRSVTCAIYPHWPLASASVKRSVICAYLYWQSSDCPD